MTTTSSAVTGTAISTDGTSIAWESRGTGPALVLIDAVLFDRATSPSGELLDPLTEAFTVITYDRRGKGQSGDTEPWAPAREVEDLVAVIEAAGSASVNVYGLSSGGTLGLCAAAQGAPIERLVVLEPPLGPLRGSAELIEEMGERIAAGEGAEAIRLFQEFQGMPAEVVEHLAPMRAGFAPVAGTIRYDLSLSHAATAELLAAVPTPTLALSSQASPPRLVDFADRVATHAPRAEHRSLPGDWHGLDTTTLVSQVREFCLR